MNRLFIKAVAVAIPMVHTNTFPMVRCELSPLRMARAMGAAKKDVNPEMMCSKRVISKTSMTFDFLVLKQTYGLRSTGAKKGDE